MYVSLPRPRAPDISTLVAGQTRYSFLALASRGDKRRIMGDLGRRRNLALRSQENRSFCCGAWVGGGRYYVFESFATPWSTESDLWIALILRQDDL